MSEKSHLAARGLVVWRGSGDARRRVLDGLDLELAPATWIDIEGPSGCGKSTLLEALARFLPLEGGKLLLDGRDAAEFPPAEWRRRVALLPQKPLAIGKTVRENLLLAWSFGVRVKESSPRDETLKAELESVGLKGLSLEAPAAELSVGQLARTALLRTILPAPEILLLDEPAANLDAESARGVAVRVRKFVSEGGAVLRARHHAADTEAECLMCMECGKLREVK